MNRSPTSDVPRTNNVLRAFGARVLSLSLSLALSVHAALPPQTGATPNVVRVWAAEPTKEVVSRWVAAVRQEHPELQVETSFPGSDVAMAGLYSGRCDIALLGREATAPEAKAFEWIFHYPPARVDVMTGGLNEPGKSPALVVFVAADNPITSLTLTQLDALAGAQRLRGASTEIRTWGELGVSGDRAGHLVRLYLPDTESGTGRYFRSSVLNGSRALNWERIEEFSDDPSVRDSSRKTLDALLRDPDGLAVASWGTSMPAGLKAVPLAADRGMAVAATKETLAARTYPLARPVFAYFNRQGNQPPTLAVRAFLDYVLSREGQRDVGETAGYLPLGPPQIAAQRLAGWGEEHRGEDTEPGFEQKIVDLFPPYQPVQSVSGELRIWGHGHITLKWLDRLTGLWAEEFRKFHPGIVLKFELHGTSSAVPAVYAGVGDVAILGEEVLPAEADAFERVKHYPLTAVNVMTGSLDVRNFDYAQIFFVHRSNPLARITLAQLDGVFGCELRRGGVALRTWGDLGVGGEEAARPITPYGWRIDDSFGYFLEQALLLGSHRWNPALHEFVHVQRPDGTIYDHGQQILDALSRDPSGIAVSNLRYATADVKPLALAETADGPYYEASKQNLVLARYPLTRLIPVVIDRPPGQPISPKTAAFVRFLLSREGQLAVIKDGRYLPLAPSEGARERKRLE